jgi:RNA polymerase sigma-70 factor (ECF subfamily)
MSLTSVEGGHFEKIVSAHYSNLYRFAYSLARNADDASDLTQQTFYRWASRGHQLKDRSKVKTWLHTTLYREFLGQRRRTSRFVEPSDEETPTAEPTVDPVAIDRLDASAVVEALWDIDELYRAPIVLFYLEDLSYQEIAEALDIPPGTVMSRLSRGKEHLRRRLLARRKSPSAPVTSDTIVKLNVPRKRVV